MTTISATFLSQYQALSHGDRRGTFVLRIDPPPAPQTRSPARVVMALDTSGSMQGQKMISAVQSAQALVKVLGANDSFACVTFADRVEVAIAPTPTNAASKKAISQKLGTTLAYGSTDLAAAMLRALELANATSPAGRVLLLTDGCPTVGVVDAAQIVALARGAKGAATLSTFGYGRDVDASLLAQLSEVGEGNYAFIEGAEPPMAAIGAELGGVLLTVAADIKVELRLDRGVTLHSLLRTGVTITSTDTGVVVQLPPLVAEEPVFLAFELVWTEVSVGQSLGTISVTGRSTEDGSALAQSMTLRPVWSTSRGALAQDAVREIIIARASVLLDEFTKKRRRQEDMLAELTMRHAELVELATNAGLSDDAQVQAALEMVKHTLRALRNNENEEHTRQDTIAAVEALRKKRNTITGTVMPASQMAFTSGSQVFGTRLVMDSQNENQSNNPSSTGQNPAPSTGAQPPAPPNSSDSGPPSRRG